jgi:myosin heavy subunit
MAMGNISFEGEKSQITGDGNRWVNTVSALLQVPMAPLQKALTIRELKIRGAETTMINLESKEASENRDALAKFVYGRLFDWLVMRINQSMGTAGSTQRSIGCLDIFGFEIFEHNSFEQLCINFTNEMLQQHFNKTTFKLEESIYRSEQIKFKHVSFIDNQPMLDLITKKPMGVLPMLDEELKMPAGSDKKFIARLVGSQQVG